jgi:hypothetical protein
MPWRRAYGAAGKRVEQQGEEAPQEGAAGPAIGSAAERQLERVQWYLGHGAWFRALEVVRRIESGRRGLSAMSAADQRRLKMSQGVDSYICANGDYVVNYGDRYPYGERIATAFVESTVNEFISRRFVKKHPVRWTKAGAHRLLQVRAQVLDGEQGDRFARWYPAVRMEDGRGQQAASPRFGTASPVAAVCRSVAGGGAITWNLLAQGRPQAPPGCARHVLSARQNRG